MKSSLPDVTSKNRSKDNVFQTERASENTGTNILCTAGDENHAGTTTQTDIKVKERNGEMEVGKFVAHGNSDITQIQETGIDGLKYTKKHNPDSDINRGGSFSTMKLEKTTRQICENEYNKFPTGTPNKFLVKSHTSISPKQSSILILCRNSEEASVMLQRIFPSTEMKSSLPDVTSKNTSKDDKCQTQKASANTCANILHTAEHSCTGNATIKERSGKMKVGSLVTYMDSNITGIKETDINGLKYTNKHNPETEINRSTTLTMKSDTITGQRHEKDHENNQLPTGALNEFPVKSHTSTSPKKFSIVCCNSEEVSVMLQRILAPTEIKSSSLDITNKNTSKDDEHQDQMSHVNVGPNIFHTAEHENCTGSALQADPEVKERSSEMEAESLGKYKNQTVFRIQEVENDRLKYTKMYNPETEINTGTISMLKPEMTTGQRHENDCENNQHPTGALKEFLVKSHTSIPLKESSVLIICPNSKEVPAMLQTILQR